MWNNSSGAASPSGSKRQIILVWMTPEQGGVRQVRPSYA